MLILAFLAVAYLSAGFGFWLAFAFDTNEEKMSLWDHFFVFLLWWLMGLAVISDELDGPHD